jgi:uncharacterized membrane protein
MQNLNVLQRMLLREETMQFLKKYWPTITSVAGGLIAFLYPSIQFYVSQHPKTAIGVLLSCVIAAYHAQAPSTKV